MEPTYPLFPILCFIFAVASAYPIPTVPPKQHLAAFMSMVWASQAAFRCFVNTVVWHGTVLDKAPVWCDISTRLDIGQNFGLPITATWMMYSVYTTLSGEQALQDERKTRRQFILGLFITVGIPIIQMGLQIIVSFARYYIFEDIGCVPATAITWQFVVVTAAWPVVFAIITLIYCVKTIRLCRKLKLARNQMFNAHSSQDQSIFFRTFLCAFINICFQVPFTVFNLYSTLQRGLLQYHDWDYVHDEYNVIPLAPRVFWDHFSGIQVYIGWVESLISAVCVFSVFGTSKATLLYYKRLFAKLAARCGIQRKEKELRFIAPRNLKSALPSFCITPLGSVGGDSTNGQMKPINNKLQDLEAQDKANTKESGIEEKYA